MIMQREETTTFNPDSGSWSIIPSFKRLGGRQGSRESGEECNKGSGETHGECYN